MAQQRIIIGFMCEPLRSDNFFISGDSWRARRTHICELQFNMIYFNMQIDFGGLDRWDYVERKRNLDEANQPIT